VNRPRVTRRSAATILVVAVLVVTSFIGGRQTDTLREERDSNGQAAVTNAESVGKAGEIIADVCKAAPAKNLKATGREKDCQLAKEGKIDEVVPVVTPTVTIRQSVSQADIERAVDDYLDDYLTSLPSKYRADLRAEVVNYLTANPPAPGKDGKPGPAPSVAVVAGAVVDYLQKNPPAPGKDGQAGTSVVAVTLDGCDLVFTYSDKTTNRVGPVCGPSGNDGADGPGPTAAELRSAIDGYCSDQPGGTCVGSDGKPGYPTGWRQQDGSVCTDPDGDHFYTCEAPPPPTDPPATSPPVTLPTG
jgi:hypothetical protein